MVQTPGLWRIAEKLGCTAETVAADARMVFSTKQNTVSRWNDAHILKKVLGLFGCSENKWSGPNDSRMTTDEYIANFSSIRELINVRSYLRVRQIPFTLKGDELNEYNT